MNLNLGNFWSVGENEADIPISGLGYSAFYGVWYSSESGAVPPPPPSSEGHSGPLWREEEYRRRRVYRQSAWG